MRKSSKRRTTARTTRSGQFNPSDASMFVARRNSFRSEAAFPRRWLMVGRVLYFFRAVWRCIRISKILTSLLGPQYRRSRNRIEIDITYSCNLRCFNCNRSVRQAPEALHMQVSQIQAFVSASIARGKRWARIRVLGGEPTLHPQFSEIVEELRRYRQWYPKCVLEIVTNGHGMLVEDRLKHL